MAVSKGQAASVFREEASAVDEGAEIDADWMSKIERLSSLCAEGGSATHIAFLGTAILAKSVAEDVDLYAIKPTHSKNNPGAYSARILSEQVLVPLAAELDVNLGVDGRQPLNNQPYFRMTYLGDGTPVHPRARAAFGFLLDLVAELHSHSSACARKALRAFIAVRRQYHTVYAANVRTISVSWVTLASAVVRLVSEDSEGGRRAQAVVAGLFDVFFGTERVVSGRINDPSRHYPGDVAVLSQIGGWEKAVEVRDKPVSKSDIYLFVRACLAKGVPQAAIVLAAPNQQSLSEIEIRSWASDRGLGLTIFYGWEGLIEQVLFWSAPPAPDVVALVVECIEARLIAVQASSDAVDTWHALTRLPDPHG
ncbi:restriction endonuclease, SacI family [Pseudomonas sp. OHS18]|uniref:restriction endonuclease, SacI family n=1 Tax=Pseudomonas sp. OHS18 TaxID=3399679 RepID=UPI003A8AF183